MINKKRVVLSVLCLLLLVFGVFSFSACKNEVDNFNLSFKVNEETYQTITTSGDEAISIPENPTKEGYTFDGWYWDKDVWSKPFTANSLMDAPISSDMSVHAKFSAIEYEITYENDGGTHSNPVSYTVEDSFALSAAEKIGYTFVGWYSDAAYTTKIESVSEGSKGAITLYAKFEINNYTISYGNTMDAVNSNVTSYNVNTDTITLSNLSKTGYVFEGWYNGEEKVTEIAKGSTGDITLTAKWSVIGYDITYHNVDGATNSNPTAYDVEDQPLTLSDASKDGYRFLGWYTDAALTNTVSEIAIGTIGDINLYAKWELIEYTATFKDGDTVVETIKFTVESESIAEPAVPNHVGYTGEWESYTLGTENITVNAVYTLISYGITYNNVSGATNNNPATYDVEDQPLTLVDASKAHYTFLGWYSDAGFNNEVTEISVGTTGPVELYAKWEAIEYTATFMDGDTEIGKVKFTVESESIAEPAVPNHVGYTGAWESYTLGTEDITIKAVYSLITYGITYNNVSGATNSNPTIYNVEDQPLALVAASKAHYTFLGWYSDAEFNNEVTEISVGTTGPVMLYAKWEAVEYTITFLYDNAIGDYAEETTVKTTYTVEDEFEFAALVCKTVGYTFDGWFTEKNVGTGTKVTGVTKGTSGNITVYAQFGLEEYDITYNNVNGATNNNPTHYNATSEDFTIYPLTKEGYTFDGWFTNEECTTPANLTITKGSNGDITIYAKWTPITYIIEYVTYGGTATGNPKTYIITDNVTFNNATLSGYVFKGWYTAAEGGIKVTGITAGTTGNIILYAHWDYVSTITFESNGGSPVNSISNVEGTAISAPVAPTKEHYTFAGWYSDAALKNAYSFKAQPAEDITLYAKWTPVVYEIEYVLNGGTNSENNVVEYTVEDKIELYAPSKVGYTFIGWFTDAEFTSSVVTELKVGTSGKITLYAHYSVNQYTISFESKGGTSVSAITQNYATSVTAPEAPSKNGYTFVGWYSNASLTSRYTFSTMPADNITLYAKWNLETYNITYNLNGGTNNSSNPATYTITSAKITLKAPTKTGYSFAGWYTDAECTEAITEIASGNYGVVELFAKWTATEYTITYVTADGATHSNILTYTIETDLTTLADAALKGHAFGGWYTDDSYATAVTTVAGGEIGNKTVYAKFTANTYNVWLDGNEEASCVVSFNLNGAEGTIASQTVTPTATLKYPTVPTRDGYIFAGWYDNESCTGSLYDFTAVVTSDTTLYAKWVKVENATAIAINGSSNVTLNGKYEQMLMFVPLVSGNITITASGSYDTFGTLYNSAMTWLVDNEDGAADGKNFHIVYNVTAGETYYIGARAFSSNTTGTATVSIAGSTTVLDGGYAITASKGTAAYGQNFTLNVPNARDGYKFLGYADENGVMYTDATGASVKKWDKDEDTILYSVWEIAVYIVTLKTDATTEFDKIELPYGARLDLSQYKPTMDGRVFVGWMYEGAAYNATTMPDYDIILTAQFSNYTMSLKVDESKTAISVNDAVDGKLLASLFNASAIENVKGGTVPMEFECTVSGTIAAGETITVIIQNTENKLRRTITGIKVYGMPTLTFDATVDYFNINGGLTASHFGASGLDTFGAATEIKVCVDGEYNSGDFVKVVIQSIDPVGNITYGYIENVKAYGLPEINYNTSKAEIRTRDVLNADLFSATASDSFGESLNVTVTLYNGAISSNGYFVAGSTVEVRVSATDTKGNVRDIIVECKVYDTPTLSSASNTDIRVDDVLTADLLGITATDTFGNKADIVVTIKDGVQSAGEIITVTATAIDVAGNTFSKNFAVKVYGTPSISYDREGINVGEDATVPIRATVTFDLNYSGATGAPKPQTVTSSIGLVYPAKPYRTGYVFRGWFTTPDCTEVFDFSADVEKDMTVYAGWHTPTTELRYIIDITEEYNSETNCLSLTSTTNELFTYFTTFESGTYRLYYKNSSSSYSYGTYLYVYNATRGKVIKSKTNITTTSYDYVSFTANAGDVIYIRTQRYNSSNSATFETYITGGSVIDAGGKYGGIYGARDILKAVAKDSFGNEIDVVATLKSGNQNETGTYVVYTLTATDNLGNTYSIDTAPIGVYDVNDIQFTYSPNRSTIIKETSKGEEFNASATDSLGNACDITIEAAEGYTLEGGKTISIYIIATDKAGNRVVGTLNSEGDPIPNIKVYGMPMVTLDHDNRVITQDTVVLSLFTAHDNFGDELWIDTAVSGEQVAGNTIVVTVTATDAAGNTVAKQYLFGVLPSEKPFVELYVDGELWQAIFVDDSSNYILPVPMLEDGLGCIWFDMKDTPYTDNTGKGILELPESIQLYCNTYDASYTPIFTAEELTNISLDGKYMLFNDLTLNGTEWTPIGTSSNPFTGTFDGNGHKISNFKVTGSVQYAGLFGYSKGTITNLGIEEFSIDVAYTSSTNQDSSHVGGLVGYNSGTITNCYATGSVSTVSKSSFISTSNYTYNSVFAGGLVGSNYGIIKDCYATGAVISTSGSTSNSKFSSSHSSCYSYAGGLVGVNGKSITNCYATGNVSSAPGGYTNTFGDYSYYSYSYAGGLVCSNSGSILNCYATGNVISSSSYEESECYAGGLVGKTSGGSITSCHATGEVKSTCTKLKSLCYAGGLVAYNNSCTINKCYANGVVTSESCTNNSASYAYAGGLIGYNYNSSGSVTNCYATGVVSSSGALGDAGGLVGYNSANITNCYATGEVSSKATYSENSSHAGGLVGYHVYGTITNCYATGNVISNCTSSSSASYSYAGGLVGYNNNKTIANSYCYSGQKFTVTKNGTTSSMATNTLATAKDMTTLKSQTFQTSTLGWNSTVWSFTDGTLPTLK